MYELQLVSNNCNYNSTCTCTCQGKQTDHSCLVLSVLLKISDTARAKIIAAVTPAEQAVNQPVKIPSKTSSSTAFFIPFASRLPKPVRGTDAPAPAKSTSG